MFFLSQSVHMQRCIHWSHQLLIEWAFEEGIRSQNTEHPFKHHFSTFPKRDCKWIWVWLLYVCVFAHLPTGLLKHIVLRVFCGEDPVKLKLSMPSWRFQDHWVIIQRWHNGAAAPHQLCLCLWPDTAKHPDLTCFECTYITQHQGFKSLNITSHCTVVFRLKYENTKAVINYYCCQTTAVS